MSVKSEPYYWLECDEPDCGNISTESSEHTAWSDVNGAMEQAEGAEWLLIDGKHYCDGHADKHNCDGSDFCNASVHVEGCFATNPDFQRADNA